MKHFVFITGGIIFIIGIFWAGYDLLKSYLANRQLNINLGIAGAQNSGTLNSAIFGTGLTGTALPPAGGTTYSPTINSQGVITMVAD